MTVYKTRKFKGQKKMYRKNYKIMINEYKVL